MLHVMDLLSSYHLRFYAVTVRRLVVISSEITSLHSVNISCKIAKSWGTWKSRIDEYFRYADHVFHVPDMWIACWVCDLLRPGLQITCWVSCLQLMFINHLSYALIIYQVPWAPLWKLRSHIVWSIDEWCFSNEPEAVRMIIQTKGELTGDRKERFEAAQLNFQKLLTNTNMLAVSRFFLHKLGYLQNFPYPEWHFNLLFSNHSTVYTINEIMASNTFYDWLIF